MIILIAVIAVIYFLLPCAANAHCDTMDGPVVMAAKKALEKGDVTPVLKWVKKHADQSVEAGREFVAAYVEFMHYVERLHLDAKGNAVHHGESNGVKAEQRHQH